MLNRTNRMLSAPWNRLNLGTRSLAALAGVNTGAQTLRVRHDLPILRIDAIPMRVGVLRMCGDPVFAESPYPPVSYTHNRAH
ncbi:MAG: hypothetical protein IRY99_18735, partial [Isosphaeraceae bacterium]|nr:hypothetical protein [Isosphaeraceae bacterium]